MQYGVLYACFGLGAALGAVSVGTVFARVSKVTLLRPGVLRVRGRARGVRAAARRRRSRIRSRLLLGYAYFVVITALSTVIQSHLVDEERGRVMALWIMGFGGTVPVGVLVGGWVGHRPRSPRCCSPARSGRSCSRVWSNAQSLRAKGAPDV